MFFHEKSAQGEIILESTIIRSDRRSERITVLPELIRLPLIKISPAP